MGNQNRILILYVKWILIHYAHVHSHIEFVSPYLSLACVITMKHISAFQKKCIGHTMQIKYDGHTAKHFQNLGMMPIDIIHRLLLNIKNSYLVHAFFFFFCDHWKLNSVTGWQTSSRFLNTFTISKARLSTSRKLPLFPYPSVFNAIITQYGMSPVDQQILTQFHICYSIYTEHKLKRIEEI